MTDGLIHERIKAVRIALKLSQRNFIKRIYISQSLLTEVETGHIAANQRLIQLIVTQYNVNKSWLLTGKGAMFTRNPSNVKSEKLINIFNELDDMLQDYLVAQSKQLLEIQKRKLKS
jgi:transcriptional regulator with XRE-family HTH domain